MLKLSEKRKWKLAETPHDRLSMFINSTKQLYQVINHCILVINIFTCMLYFWIPYTGCLSAKFKYKTY